MEVLIKTIENIQGTNKKISHLKVYKYNETIKKLFKLGLDPNITFGISDVTCNQETFHNGIATISDAVDLLQRLHNREFTGHTAQDWVNSMYQALSTDDAFSFRRTLRKKINCGLGVDAVNKVWPKLIPVPNYGGSQSGTDAKLDKLNWAEGVMVEEKRNGSYCCIRNTRDWGIVATLRSGDSVLHKLHRDTIEDFKYVYNVAIEGELEVFNTITQCMLPVEAANGYLNSDDDIPGYTVVFTPWTILPLEEYNAGVGTRSYQTGRELLEQYCSDFLTMSPVKYKLLHSKDAAKEYTKEIIREGGEGTVCKPINCIWKSGKMPWQLKLKNATDCDLICTGYKPHKTKPELIGSLIMESSDGLLKVNVGSGLNDADRVVDFGWFDNITFKVRFETVTSDKRTKRHSLKFPRFPKDTPDQPLSARLDKSLADTLQHIQNEEAMSRGMFTPVSPL